VRRWLRSLPLFWAIKTKIHMHTGRELLILLPFSLFSIPCHSVRYAFALWPGHVSVAPRWSYEPMDTAIMLGNTISINCEAEGYPIPTITWFKGQGKFANPSPSWLGFRIQFIKWVQGGQVDAVL